MADLLELNQRWNHSLAGTDLNQPYGCPYKFKYATCLPKKSNIFVVLALVFSLLACHRATAQQAELLGHWTLQNSLENSVQGSPNLVGTGLKFESVDGMKGMRLSGKDSAVQLPANAGNSLGNDPFSIAVWVHTDGDSSGLVGDLVSQYDPSRRIGFQLGIHDHLGVTTGQPNRRQLHFGMDQAQMEEQFTDHGQLGSSVFVFSLCVYRGSLYASTCCVGSNEAGHVFRWLEGDRWQDLGSPDKSNAISSMVVFEDRLFVASSKYRLAGSSLQESDNPHAGGKVFRLNEKDGWDYCGTVSPETEAISSLIEFRGELYASSLYKPAGFFRYEGGDRWISCATADGKRTEALTVFQDSIFATCYDEGSVFRFDGDRWTLAGKIPNATQTYGFGVYRGELYVSEWPQAHVYRYERDHHWHDVGKLGEELEAMPLLVYNGKLFGGTLPNAQIFRYDDQQQWTRIGQVDQTPDVKYRRAWSMAVYDGRLFVGTLPSGRVLSIECGKNATWDHPMPKGWHQIVAVRGKDRLRLYVDGEQVATSSAFEADRYAMADTLPIEIGSGATRRLTGLLSDLRIYQGELSVPQISALNVKTDADSSK